jgi:hypothetical protein
MTNGFKLPPPPPPLSGMGQVIPPLPTQVYYNVLYLSLGAVAFSIGLVLILRNGKKKK